MKIRIDKYGSLQIERAGRWVEQMCKDTMALEEDGTHCGLGCGHWCPLFGEPEDEMRCMKPLDTECTSWATGCEPIASRATEPQHLSCNFDTVDQGLPCFVLHETSYHSLDSLCWENYNQR